MRTDSPSVDSHVSKGLCSNSVSNQNSTTKLPNPWANSEKLLELFELYIIYIYIYIFIYYIYSIYIYTYSILCTQLLTHVKVYETVKDASFRTHIFQPIWMSSILGHAEYRLHKPLPNGIYGVESTIKKGFGVPLLLHLQPKNYNLRAAIQRNFVLISFLEKTLCFLDSCTVLQILHPKNTSKNMAVLLKFWASLQAKQNFNEELILDEAMNLSGRGEKSIDSQRLEAFCHGKTKRENVDMVNWLSRNKSDGKWLGFSRKLLTSGFELQNTSFCDI